MKKQLKNKPRYTSVAKAFAVVGVLLSAIVIMAFGLNSEPPKKAVAPIVIRKDSAASVKAFKQVYSVLMSARCMNCHPSGNIPLQGDDSHLHTMSPQRGVDGKGVYAMKCANCHQATNTLGLHTPPGNPNWHLPPADMKMIFQGRSPRQLAKQIVDPKQNGHKDMQKLIAHADDGLVLSGWNPGEGRTLPPMSHAAFKKAWITWLTTGAYAPKK
ncbi:hypothetical protein PQ469_27150 [Mucilaginibacter sp. KACC 22773]|uniref:hypothetical protein n=1 Tax=Mucilaginibacter sp. KACC 22773 TaxID=3025671 RepID=UPI0023672F81|nr:hypothetical protein [Mucilaginibacter sp. KACC 22773]WDF77568.1 hypothetical protein PQ469_27150 [Mucilaginibacter sp. KACC 22773]